MKKSEWYENRILWRAKKLRLEPHLWQNFFLSNEQAAGSILAKVGEYGVPLIVFWLSDDVWTLVTNQFLVGKLESGVSTASLDSLGDIFTINDRNLPPAELKQCAEYIKVGLDEKKFWTPTGNSHFSLLNILRMFPINVP